MNEPKSISPVWAIAVGMVVGYLLAGLCLWGLWHYWVSWFGKTI